MLRKIAGALCATLLLALPIGARASLVTYQATGTVADTFGASPGLPTPIASAVVGEPVVFQWTVDTTTPASSSVPGEAQYNGALTALSVQFGASLVTVNLSTGTDEVYIDDNNSEIIPEPQTYETGYGVDWLSPAYDIYMNTSYAGRGEQNLYLNTALTNVPLDPAVANVEHNVEFSEAGNLDVIVNIDTISTIPLPPTAWLLLSGIPLILLVLRGRSNHSLETTLVG